MKIDLVMEMKRTNGASKGSHADEVAEALAEAVLDTHLDVRGARYEVTSARVRSRRYRRANGQQDPSLIAAVEAVEPF